MSNLSDIGFPVAGEQDVNELIMQVLEHVREIRCPNGFYLKFSDTSGAEIYLQGNKDQELIGFNPHFAGKSRRRVGLARAIERDSSELDGGFFGWADPQSLKIEHTGMYPFVFDLPDFRTVGEIEFPKILDIQLTAFASSDFGLFNNEQEFFATPDPRPKLSSRSFVPSGMFMPDKKSTPIEPPRPFAFFAGIIKEFELKTNQFSGEQFYWFLIDTTGGEIDVVADPKLVPAEPVVGGIVNGEFWLSGRLVD